MPSSSSGSCVAETITRARPVTVPGGGEAAQDGRVGVRLQPLEVVVVHAEDLDQHRVLDLVGRVPTTFGRDSRISL